MLPVNKIVNDLEDFASTLLLKPTHNQKIKKLLGGEASTNNDSKSS